MFGLYKLIDKAEDFFAEIGLASVVGGTAALYLMVTQDTNTLATIAGIAAIPHVLSNKGNILSSAAYEVIGAFAPFVGMQLMGILGVESALFYVGGAVIGGLLGASISVSTL